MALLEYLLRGQRHPLHDMRFHVQQGWEIIWG